MTVTREDANDIARIIGSLVMLSGKLPGVAVDGLATRAELMAEVDALTELVGRAKLDETGQ